MKWFSTSLLLLSMAFIPFSGCVTETKVTNTPVSNSNQGMKDIDVGPNPEEKIAELQKKFNENPNDPKVAWDIGFIYYQTKNYRLAEAWMKDSIRLVKNKEKYKGMFRLYFYVGKSCLQQKGKEDEAVKYFNKVLSIKFDREVYRLEFKEFRMSHYFLAILKGFKGLKRTSDHHFKHYVQLGGSPKKVKEMKYRISRISQGESFNNGSPKK